ncbi:MAG TPA: YceI family protein [Solirubrobacteraceae bacterium]|nr:YceI family protein [Solirubrobacteraceae bacterium]
MAASAQTAIAPGTYTVDRVHSTVGFTVRHMVVAKFRGGFSDYNATLTVGDGGEISLEGAVKVDSVEVKEPNLAGHLKSPDFFDAERYPEILFSSRSAELAADGSLTVAGDLTIKGTTKPVTSTGELHYVEGGGKAGLELTTVIDRTQFGLNWNADLPHGGVAVAHDVTLHVELELGRED